MSSARPKKRRRLEIEPETFQHAPLDLTRPCIRLFNFLPKLSDGYLRLELLNNVTLADQPVYRALSYEWGPLEPTRDLMVNKKLFSVRENLHDFLESLYAYHGGADASAYFWADAICIRQDDNEEMNHQVRQMSELYQSTIEALAWVEESHSVRDGELFEALRKGYSTLIKRHGRRVAMHYAMEELWRTVFGEILDNAELHLAFVKLCNRSYWTRL